jgi:RNA 2',3'-cyclic 3'-phosphodiesterase
VSVNIAEAMRVFLAVDLRDTLGAPVHAWGTAVASAIGARAAAGLTWVPPPRIHVTLHFFGELSPEDVDRVEQALGDAVPASPFDLRLGGGGVFPPSGRPRVLWLGFADGGDELARLHAWIEPRVAGLGQPDRHAGFTPHVTVARVRREPSPGLGRALRDAAARTPAPDVRARVEAVTLFQSVQSAGEGPSYLPLARVRLA